MSLIDPEALREAAAERGFLRQTVALLVVAAALTALTGRSLADFAVLAVVAVAVPTVAVVVTAADVSERARRAGGGLVVLALAAAMVYFGLTDPAPLLALVGAVFALLGLYTLWRVAREAGWTPTGT
ncbi:hypothetical protein J2752_002479 [Halarchaeum rubridurum]|uniref:Uncharacterized protein n=1 Tax=Halarchaeum rubridurum TaxID=489911 RepID=A0A830G3H5_9EURY|nr:hypothetical protein [Halarchaeum rubridurum]MBP1955556.1 hypothetical protein [Halarchaeum rubridurum]GGM73323.1 hypothetical protein GCM10009017_24050 [Halarchaeum rubridurum]